MEQWTSRFRALKTSNSTVVSVWDGGDGGPFCYELDASRAKILYIQLHQIFVVMILALVNFVLM